MLETGKLFQPNTELPVAAHFPGLEEVGAAVANLTGMSVTATGMLVAGVLHLMFVGALFMMVRRAGGSPSMAGAACAIYATSLHYLFFDSMYIYQTAALPFLTVVVWATRAWRRDEPGYLPYALVGGVAVSAARRLAADLGTVAVPGRQRTDALAVERVVAFGWVGEPPLSITGTSARPPGLWAFDGARPRAPRVQRASR